MTKLFLIGALLASATAASASVVYDFSFTGRGNPGPVAWQFTVANYLSNPGDNYISTFTGTAFGNLGNPLSVDISNPFSTSPFISTNGDQGSLSSGGWVGPFNHDGTFSNGGATLVITSSASTSAAPEPSPLALIGAGGVLLALVRRRRWLSPKQIVS